MVYRHVSERLLTNIDEINIIGYSPLLRLQVVVYLYITYSVYDESLLFLLNDYV